MNTNECSAQRLYRLAALGTGMPATGTFFKVIAGDTSAAADSTSVVLHVEAGGKPLISYRGAITASRRKINFIPSDSLVHDSSTFALVREDRSGTLRFKVSGVYGNDLKKQAPVFSEVFYSAGSDTVQRRSDTAGSPPKPPGFSVHGNITLNGQLADNKYLYQAYPQSYLRTQVNARIDAYGIPFTVSWLNTTENNTATNPINNFRFSFDYNTFYSKLKSRMDARLRDDKQHKLAQLSEVNIRELNTENGRLNAKLNNRDYRRQLDKHRKVMEDAERDPALKKSYRYKRSQAFMLDHDKKLKRLEEIAQLRKVHLDQVRLSELYGGVKEIDLEKPSGFRRAARKYGFTRPGYGLLLSVKKLDLGTFDPDYTRLVMGGVSLTGFNIELNPGYLYAAFSIGTTVANFSNPFASDIGGGRTLIAGRAGVGRTEKMLLAASILKGKDNSGNIVYDSASTYYLPSNNYVLGIDYTYRIGNNAKVGAELARTINEPTAGSAEGAGAAYKNLVDLYRFKYANAWTAYGEVSITQTGTKLRALTRMVDPFYYSFGTPFLRRDDFRVEAGAEQPLLNNRLTAGITYRRNEDNLYNTKEGTTINSTYVMKLHYKPKRYPYVIFIYSPSYQQYYNSATKQTFNSRIKLYTLISGYMHNGRSIVSNTVFTYSKSYNESSENAITLFHIDHYALTQTLLFKPIGLTLTASGFASLPMLQADTGRSAGAELRAAKNIFRKLVLKAGYAWQKDFMLQERTIISAGADMSLPWGLSMMLGLERHFIYVYNGPAPRQDMHLGRLTVIKTF